MMFGDAIMSHKVVFESANKTGMLVAHANFFEGLPGIPR